jgi:hypothetical protein
MRSEDVTVADLTPLREIVRADYMRDCELRLPGTSVITANR